MNALSSSTGTSFSHFAHRFTSSRRGQGGASTSRLNTAVSIARPQTAASVNTGHREASYIVAVIEGRGISREIGIAALDKDTGKTVLIQVADCQTYVKTMHHLHLHTPELILIPDTFLPSATPSKSRNNPSSTILVDCMQEEFSGVPMHPVMRKYWSEIAGLDFIHQLCVDNEDRTATLVSVSNKYYALSAAAALFKHMETRLNTIYAARSLRITYTPVEGTMMIDTETAKNLELVGNMTRKKSSHSLFGRVHSSVSLFTLDYTYTPMAGRLLRVNLLAPITVQSSIDARLDVVEELVQTEDMYLAVRDGLRALKKVDLDKLIASIAASQAREPSTTSSKPASSRVAQMLNVRNVVRSLPALHSAIQHSKSQLLKIISNMLSDNRIPNIEKKVSESLNEGASSSKKGGLGALNIRVYAVKASINRLLDVARETYRENVGDIYQLCRELSEQHDLPFELSYSDTGGHVFALRKTELDGELPRGFINVTSKGGKWCFSSVELKKRNARMKDALDETLILSDKVIHDLLDDVLQDIGALYKASEAVALLDMLWSFAHSSIFRPEFTGTLAIKAGRHPILERVQSSAGTLVPNDVYCCDSSSFQLVQGPNMSGKSTYLRQIGLLTILAMCGCFVPAEYASFRLVLLHAYRVHDALLGRLSNDDDMERSLSTFANEMASSAMILSLATSRSLVLIDELGRGTSPREGVGIAHAIAEEFIRMKAFAFFATHFSELSTTLSRFPSVVNLHLSVQRTRRNASSFGMIFKYKIIDGPPEDLDHYGIELAVLADLPQAVIVEGQRVANLLSELHAKREGESRSGKVALRRKALLRLRTQLTQALEYSTLPDEDLFAYVSKIQHDIVELLGETLEE
ncbi:muts domain V-domain-containing protein [Gautieria morchelliformis]|nr:muts domain V-domain-containing protein [Gautieria morchelliformis]